MARWCSASTEPACVIVKHANPCGVAVGDDIADAYVKANACDPVSAFGGIVALNRSRHRRRRRGHRPGVHRGRRRPVVRRRRAGRSSPSARTCGCSSARRRTARRSTSVRSTAACSCRTSTPSTSIARRGRWSPTAAPDRRAVGRPAFAWQVCAAVSSNAIVYAKDRQAFGIGAGQQNRRRLRAHRRRRVGGRADGGVCRERRVLPVPRRLRRRAPTPACVAVIQPGGSMNDDESIAAAERARHRHGVHRRAPLPPLRRRWPTAPAGSRTPAGATSSATTTASGGRRTSSAPTARRSIRSAPAR